MRCKPAPAVLVLSHYVRFQRTTAEQSATAVLMSKLLDTSVLDYHVCAANIFPPDYFHLRVDLFRLMLISSGILRGACDYNKKIF